MRLWLLRLMVCVVGCPAGGEAPPGRRAGAQLGKSPALLAAEQGEPPVKGPSAKGKAPIYDEQADPRELLDAALDRAGREGKRVLVTFGGNWCGWCHALHELLRDDAELRGAISRHYVQVLIDSRSSRDLQRELGAELRNVPFLSVLEPSGDVVVHRSTLDLEQGPTFSRPRVLDFLRKHAP